MEFITVCRDHEGNERKGREAGWRSGASQLSLWLHYHNAYQGGNMTTAFFLQWILGTFLFLVCKNFTWSWEGFRFALVFTVISFVLVLVGYDIDKDNNVRR
jgi:hypothetical protein